MEIEYIIAIFVIVGIVLYLKRKKDDDVPVGLQTFDKDGNLMLDATTPGVFSYGFAYTGTSPGTVLNSKIKKDSTFIYVFKTRRGIRGTTTIYDDNEHDVRGYPIRFTIQDGSISWDWDKLGGNMDFADGDFVTVMWFVYGGITGG